MTQNVQAFFGPTEDGIDSTVSLEREGQVSLPPVDQGSDRARLTPVDVLDDLASGGAAGVLMGVIGTHVNRYHRH
jgi:hypothetical protein